MQLLNSKERVTLTLGGAAEVRILSSSAAVVFGVCCAAGAGAEVAMEAGPEGGLVSLLILPLLVTTAGLSLSFFLLSVLTIGWS